MTHPLDAFRAPASIDYITVGRHLDIPLRASSSAVNSLPKFNGSVELPDRTVHSPNQSWMTIHDPSKKDLQTLIDDFHTAYGWSA